MLKVCTNCGFTWDEITSANLAGCRVCYEVFEEDLKQVYNVWNGTSVGRTVSGNSARETKADTQKFEELSKLREKLSKALIQENFEEAGKLKKELAELENRDGLD